MDRDTITRMCDLDDRYRQLLVRSNRQLLSTALNELDNKIKSGETVTPPPCDIFRAFKLTPWESLRVVIIGQDPFIRPSQATGLSFSVPRKHNGKKVVIPPSTRAIYKCLSQCNVLADMPDHGDLTAWATQGVLLLNTALTTKIATSNAHKFWHAYTDKIIRDISEQFDFVVFMLWGGFAQAKSKLIDAKKHCVLEWGHPSPLNTANKNMADPRNFIYCDHFIIANQQLVSRGLPSIDWNPDCRPQGDFATAPVTRAVATVDKADKPLTVPPTPRAYAFTDGGATANGKATCKASWGYYIHMVGSNNTTTHRASGIVPAVKIGGAKFNSSNNRGEITALVKAIEWLEESSYPHDIEIVSDSKYLIDCLTKWIPKWIREDKTAEKKNTDLLIPLYQRIHKMPNVINFKHVNSHRIAPAVNTPEYFYWYGNDIADKLCAGELAG